MVSHTKDWIIVSLGGSLMVPDTIDTVFLNSFITLIRSYCEKGQRFIIITGGGKTCRRYQASAKELFPDATIGDLDWVGIYATRLNAVLLRVAFGDLADTHLLTDPSEFPQTPKSIVVGAGWEPGWSTDYDAVTLAHHVGAASIINLSNIDHVYDSDPRTNPDAKAFETLTWSEYRVQIPREWSPGLNTPFDPMAAEKAQEYGLEVAIINGNNLENFHNYLSGKEFKGTRITDTVKY